LKTFILGRLNSLKIFYAEFLTFFYYINYRNPDSIKIYSVTKDEMTKSTQFWNHFTSKVLYYLGNGDMKALCKDPELRLAFMLDLKDNRGSRFKSQIKYLRNIYSTDFLRTVLPETKALPIKISSILYRTSQSRVNHLACWELANSLISESKNYPVIVEFGGGYGGIAELLTRIKSFSTYIIIDFDEMISLQMFYLKKSGILNVNVIQNLTDEVLSGSINLLPATLLGLYKGFPKVDLFLAMWSLSEADRDTQDLILDLDYFGAEVVYFFYHVNPNSDIPNTNRVVFPKYDQDVISKLPWVDSDYSSLKVMQRSK
jgi:hypothetical protein